MLKREAQVDLHVRLPKELHERLVQLAAQERRSLNNLLVVLLEEHAKQRAQEG